MKKNKSSKWKYFFIVLLILNIVIYSPYLLVVLAEKSMNLGPGTGIGISIILTLLFYFAVIPVTIINIICIIRFLITQRPKGDSRSISYVFIFVSVVPIIILTWPLLEGYGGSLVNRIRKITLSREVAIKLINDCHVEAIYWHAFGGKQDESSLRLKDQKDNPYRYFSANDYDAVRETARSVRKRCGRVEGSTVKNPHGIYITIDEATTLLNKCEIFSVIYNQDDFYSIYDKPEGQPSGILLDSKEDPIDIYIHSDLTHTILPIISEAKKKCPNLETSGD